MNEEEARVLAWTILGEAAGEGRSGMTAVAHVIRNRAESGRFPSNPAAVALQHNSRGIYQFSTWNALSMQGNIPRSRYPVGSSEFSQAMSIVQQVFGPTPGSDPTRGATHYYSHAAMDEPYWWNSEAPQGGLKIGNHTFAYKYEPKQAPTPATRTPSPASILAAMSYAGQERNRQTNPTPAMQSPWLAAARATDRTLAAALASRAPRPATPSLQLQVQRENEGASVRSITTYVYDPVRQALVPRSSASDRVRAAGSAKAAQQLAALSGPSGRGRPVLSGTPSVVAEGFSWAGMDRGTAYVPPKPANGSASDRVRAAQQRYMPPQVPGPNGEWVPKDQSRLLPGLPPPANYPRPVPIPAQQSAALAAQRRPPVAPVPRPPLVRPQPPVARPPDPTPARPKPVTVPEVILGTNGYVYQGGKQVGTVRPVGMTPAEQYDFVNAASRERARATASNPIHSGSDWFNRVTGRSGIGSGDSGGGGASSIFG